MSPAYADPGPCGRCGIALEPEQDGRARCVCGAQVRVFRFAPFRAPEGAALPAAPGPAGDTPCAYHARNAASAACRRCGSFVCSLCLLQVAADGYCPPCFERLRGAGDLPALRARYPRPHAQALALGVVSLGLPGPNLLLAPLVLWLALRALRERAGLSERERFVVPQAVLGLLLGLSPLVLLAVLVALFFKERA